MISRANNYYHSKMISNELNVYPDHLRELRIPNIDFNTYSEEVISLVKQLQRASKGRYKNLSSNRKNIVDSLLAALNRVVYSSFDLNESEIREIENWSGTDQELPNIDDAIEAA